MTTLAVAIIAGVLGPVILAWLTGRQRHAEKVEDWRRQDEVAARLVVANKVVSANSDKLDANTDKLDEIHTLVNSNMTKVMQAELDATVREAALMREVVELNRAAGREPTQHMLDAIVETDAKINELRANIKDRLDAAE